MVYAAVAGGAEKLSTAQHNTIEGTLWKEVTNFPQIWINHPSWSLHVEHQKNGMKILQWITGRKIDFYWIFIWAQTTFFFMWAASLFLSWQNFFFLSLLVEGEDKGEKRDWKKTIRAQLFRPFFFILFPFKLSFQIQSNFIFVWSLFACGSNSKDFYAKVEYKL
jgi:hypothetical protein